jgi:hypothetical protein
MLVRKMNREVFIHERQGEVIMSKKHRKKNRTRANPLAAAMFSAGTIVRVKPGTMDPGFADIPLGGWTGTIQNVDQHAQPRLYHVQWNQDTLDQMHPVYRKRCHRDDLEIENMWLAEDELELDTGEPAKVEQPTNLISRSLSKDDQDDRIRALFGLTSDDRLPFVNDDNLCKYHRHLATHLSFPFEAQCQAGVQIESGRFEEKPILATVTGLLHSDHYDENCGILCEATEDGGSVDLSLAEIESTVNIHNRQLVEDYAYWFHNSPGESSEVDAWTGGGFVTSSQWILPERSSYRAKRWPLFEAVVKCGIAGGVIGIPLGSLFAAMEIVQFGAIVGAVIVGFLGYWAGARFGMFFGTVNRLKHGSFYGSILGAIGGGIVGALIGALLGAVVGMLVGSLIGALISQWLLQGRKKMLGVVLGAAAGATMQAFYFDQEKAIEGAIYGAVIGALAGVVIVLAIYGLLIWFGRRQHHS